MTIARLKKDLAHLIKKNTTWQKTINLLQDFLNEEFARHEFVKDRSFGEHVYHKLEGMGLNDQNVLDLFQNFMKIDPKIFLTIFQLKTLLSNLSKLQEKML